MSTSIDNAFVKQFEREVHTAYQRTGSRLRPTVRNSTNVNGSIAVFQKISRGTASTKATHGMVPVMSLDHTPVEVVLSDFYAGDWVDRLDELKINIDERQVIATAGAGALGRKTDDMIINAMASATTHVIGDGNTGISMTKLMDAFEQLGKNDVPDDGQRFCVVGWKQWRQMLQIPEFVSSDYVGEKDLPFAGSVEARKWLGTTFMPHSALPIDGNDIRSCFWYHKTAIGHAAASDVKTDITWHGDRAAHFVNNMMSQGAGLIDAAGVIVIKCDETPD